MVSKKNTFGSQSVAATAAAAAAAAAASAAAAAACVCTVLYGDHAKAVFRRHRRALFTACGGPCCAVCVCRTRLHFSLTGRVCNEYKMHTDHPRQHAAVVDKYAAVSSMLHLHPADPRQHDVAGFHRGLALAWPRHTGHVFVEIVAWCGGNYLPCEPVASLLLHAVRSYIPV